MKKSLISKATTAVHFISVLVLVILTLYLEPDKEVEKLFKNTAMWSRVLEVGIVVYRIFIKPDVIEIL